MSGSPPEITVQLIYVSRAKSPQTTTVTTSILLQAQVHNKVSGISGLLCQGQGYFLQVLEGDRSKVNALYQRICLDTRHKDVELLHYQEITQRRFHRWSMALVKLQGPQFDPYAASGEHVMQLLSDLIESAQPITAP
jgi:hypothetical protein